jgi:Ca-activated chloride channel family protein
MSPALAKALSGAAPEGYLRQVVFMTDGSVGNERELFAQIQQDLGSSRLFTVGIGSAPNAFFMRKAAEFGRGTYTYIGDVSDVQGQMQDLFSKLENPVITNLTAQLPESSEAYPATLPDLYLGEPVVMTVRLPQSAASSDIVISGNIAGDPWQRRLLGLGGRNSEAQSEARDTGLAQLWARDKIDSLSDDMVGESGETFEQLEQTITQVALDYNLVSDYTSLVAIDTTPVRPEEAGLERGDVLQTLPAGQNYDGIFGYPNTATPALRHILLGMMALLLALISVLPGSSERPGRRAL